MKSFVFVVLLACIVGALAAFKDVNQSVVLVGPFHVAANSTVVRAMGSWDVPHVMNAHAVFVKGMPQLVDENQDHISHRGPVQIRSLALTGSDFDPASCERNVLAIHGPDAGAVELEFPYSLLLPSSISFHLEVESDGTPLTFSLKYTISIASVMLEEYETIEEVQGLFLPIGGCHEDTEWTYHIESNAIDIETDYHYSDVTFPFDGEVIQQTAVLQKYGLDIYLVDSAIGEVVYNSQVIYDHTEIAEIVSSHLRYHFDTEHKYRLAAVYKRSESDISATGWMMVYHTGTYSSDDNAVRGLKEGFEGYQPAEPGPGWLEQVGIPILITIGIIVFLIVAGFGLALILRRVVTDVNNDAAQEIVERLKSQSDTRQSQTMVLSGAPQLETDDDTFYIEEDDML